MGANSYWVYECQCKDCKEPFNFTETALQSDIAHGLSTPLRCPSCRKQNSRGIREAGLSYWPVPLETDFTNRSGEEVGLGKLDHGVASSKKVEYQPDLEVAEKFKILQPAVDELIKNLLDPHGSRVSILVGPTGTGKSVWATSQILRSPIGDEGRILVTQPRKVTLRAPEDKGVEETTPGYIATKLLNAPGVGPGHEVGFLYKGESTQHDRYTRLLFVTDGLLIKWILSGEIGRYSVIMIDEAHEQSANMELIFSLLRYKLPLYPRLQVVIMSATVDAQKFQAYFQNFGCGSPKTVPIFKPENEVTREIIHDRWPGDDGTFDGLKIPDFELPSLPKHLPGAIAKIVKAIRKQEGFSKLKKPYGDILVFVPTRYLVEQTQQSIEALDLKHLDTFPCHAKTSEEEQSALLESEVKAEQAYRNKKETFPQRVIIATNYAETSVTFSNLRYVIDSGYILQPTWNSESCSKEYKSSYHSQAGCTQRKGRVGRQQEGEFFRLYTKEKYENDFRATPLPEIARSNLDMFLLKAAAAGIDDLQKFQWLGFSDTATQKQQEVEKERAITLLRKRGALDDEGDITKNGYQLEKIQTDTIDLALFMDQSDSFACSLEVATFLAFVIDGVSTWPFARNDSGLLSYERWRTGCHDDLEFYLRLFHNWQIAKKGSTDQYESWLSKNGFEADKFEGIETKRNDILKQFIERTHTPPTKRDLDLERLHRVRLVLAQCMPEWVYVSETTEKGGRFFIPYNQDICPCSKPVAIDRNSACALSDDVTAFICIERINKQKSLFASHIVRIKPEWIEKVGSSGQIALSILLRRTIDGEDKSLSDTCRSRVTVVPKQNINLDSYTKGEVKAFILIRSQYDKDDAKTNQNTLLVKDVETGLPCLIRLQETDKPIYPGSTFHAEIKQVDHDRNTIIASRRSLVPAVGTKIEHGRISRELSDESSKEVYAYLIEIGPGVEGKIDVKSLGRSKQWIENLKDGKLPLVVDSVEHEKIKLRPFVAPQVDGQEYVGYITGFRPGKNGHKRGGAYIEIAPGILERLYREQVLESQLLSYDVGDEVHVILRLRANGQRDLEPISHQYSSDFLDLPSIFDIPSDIPPEQPQGIPTPAKRDVVQPTAAQSAQNRPPKPAPRTVPQQRSTKPTQPGNLTSSPQSRTPRKTTPDSTQRRPKRSNIPLSLTLLAIIGIVLALIVSLKRSQSPIFAPSNSQEEGSSFQNRW